MHDHRQRYLLLLSSILIVGLCLSVSPAPAVSPAQAQTGLFNDFTFGFYGNNRERSRLNREDVIAREGYCPAGGCILRLDSVEVKPNRARRGDTLLLSTTYTILTPEQVSLPVAITREIFYQGKSLGRTKSIDTRRENGTWTQEINFTLPPNAAPGIYRLVTLITTGYGTAQDTTDFQVD
jgi:hypothetical protein